jgi:ABC-type proline/glycine betaine transport system ATPase subunit
MRIAELADRQIGELSGGQQQRVMLARTLAQDADLEILGVHFYRALFLDRQLIGDRPLSEVLTAETIAQSYGFQFLGRREDSRWSTG